MPIQPSRLVELELVVEHGQRTFVEVGIALRTIRDERLYDAEFGTFEAYCRVRFGMSRAYLYRIISAAAVVENLSPMGDISPRSERIARPLTRLQPDAQREVWSEAIGQWDKPTAANVEEVAAQLFPKPVAKQEKRYVVDGPTCRMWLVLDDPEEVAMQLSNAMPVAWSMRLYELLGLRIEKLREYLRP